MAGIGGGVELEWSIVFHARLKNGQLSPNTSDQKMQAYSEAIASQARDAVDKVSLVVPGKFESYHSDNWKGKSIIGNPEPKTDVVFEQKNRPYFSSVKMRGPIQLASGEGKSTATMFKRVAESLGNKSRILKDLISSLESMPSRLLSESNFDRIMNEGKPKIIEEFIKNGKIKKDKSYEYWIKNNKEEIMSSLFAYLKKDPDFQFALIKEAMTGELVFGKGNPATATHIVTPDYFTAIDNAYVKKMMGKTKIDIRAKSRGGISSVAFRFDVRS